MAGDTSPHRDGEVPLRDLLGDQVLDLLLERSKDGKGGLRLTGDGSMLGELVKAVLERALEAELSSHLGYGKHDPAGHGTGNSRNGRIGKTVQTGVGPVRLAVPRDRAGTFEPVLPPVQREIMAWTIDGYTPAEIAELLDKSPPAVRVNLFKARATLRIALAGMGGDDG
ncbi:hypothetical protein E1294_45525 [Nonomuraea diastatica]|uniref:Mutator family transposase n=1 Tax=Nonomuraea diastatica TaxID=1848329 RepID=A0A4R4WCM4_9ACTN|nr:hypothetical protein E1294_45525 [Nonomuraea diastatica]